MYKIIGLRKNGMSVFREYKNQDVNVAKFEFEILQPVSEELKLYENDVLIDEYIKPKADKLIEYLIIGESAFNNIYKVVKNNRERAELIFNSESSRCNWLTMYEKIDNEQKQVKVFIKGVA